MYTENLIAILLYKYFDIKLIC